MTASNRRAPVGELIETSRQLELGSFAERQLADEMKQTVRELEGSPLVTPLFTSIKLGRISLFNSAGEQQGNDRMWLRYSENTTAIDHNNASIGITEDGQHRSFSLSKQTQKWEERRDHTPNSVGELTSEELVHILHSKIKRPEALAPLLDDSDFDPMDIVCLLASHLTRSSMRREKGLVYGTENMRLAEIEISGRYIHTLQTSAPYEIGKTTIHKGYSFAAESSNAFFYNASGSVTVSSKDGYTQSELEPYTLSKYANSPVFSLYHALTSIREQHGLADDLAA